MKDNPNIDESDPEEAPMNLEDYGIIDALTPQMLAAIDEGLMAESSILRLGDPISLVPRSSWMTEKVNVQVPESRSLGRSGWRARRRSSSDPIRAQAGKWDMIREAGSGGAEAAMRSTRSSRGR
jgi:hypothetical protein